MRDRKHACNNPYTQLRKEVTIDEVLASNPDEVDKYRGGKEKVFGFFVGQVMKATRGQANPKLVNQMLDIARIEAESMVLEPAHGDLGHFLRHVTGSFQGLAEGQDSPSVAAANELGIPVLRLRPDEGNAAAFTLEGTGVALAETPSPHPSDIALVLHTSGTTARPKIVPLSTSKLKPPTARTRPP